MDTQLREAEEQLVVLELSREMYGVEIGRVQEIIRTPAITRLPQTPELVEGVINLRGKVIPVVDLRRHFGLEHVERGTAGRVVVVDVEGQIIGMVVDGVSEVLRVPAGAVDPPSPLVTNHESGYLRGIAKLDGRLILLLDLARLLSWEEKRALQEAA
jgi:purine-binding chemotaxis protein CheW